VGQERCDDAFLSDMKSICRTRDVTLGELGRAECYLAAEGFMVGVERFGAKSFNKGQTWSQDHCTVQNVRPPDGAITVRNEAGFVAWYTATFVHNGRWQTPSSGRFPISESRDVTIPHDATNITLSAHGDVVGRIDRMTSNAPFSQCYQVRGNIFGARIEACTN